MVRFCTEITINNKPVTIKELKLKHYKIIQKALLGAEDNFNTLIKNLVNILVKVSSLTYEEINNLNYIDFCKLLFYVRSISMGNIIYARTLDTETEVIININKLLFELDQLNFEQILTPIIKGSLVVNFKIPTIYDITTKDVNNSFKNNFSLFTNINLFDETFYENLPVTIFLDFNKRFQLINSFIKKINLLSYLPDNNDILLPLTPDISNLVLIFQLLFSTDLSTLYENMFALSKMANMSPSYLENCTPGEYNLYVNLLRNVIKIQTSEKKNEPGHSAMPPINKAAPTFM